MAEPEIENARRVESVEFEPVRIGGKGGRRRSPLVAVAWLAVLASFVAFAALGRSDPSDTAVAHRTPSSAPSVPAVDASRLLGVALRPDTPQTFAITVTTVSGGLAVNGLVLGHTVERVSIRVVDTNGAALATRSLSVIDPNGGVRPDHQRAFSLVFGLSARKLLTASFVEVDGYDSFGDTVGSGLHSLATLLGPCGAGRPCGGG